MEETGAAAVGILLVHPCLEKTDRAAEGSGLTGIIAIVLRVAPWRSPSKEGTAYGTALLGKPGRASTPVSAGGKDNSSTSTAFRTTEKKEQTSAEGGP